MSLSSSLWLRAMALLSFVVIPFRVSGGEVSRFDKDAFAFVPGGLYQPLFSEPRAEPNPARPSDSVVTTAPQPLSVSAFYLARYPVTKAEFLEFVKSRPEWQRLNVKRIFAMPGYLSSWKKELEFSGDAQQPITEVSWFAAKAYCQARGLRLPSTAEWEYVARASETEIDAGEDSAYLSRILNWYARKGTTLTQVGSWKNVYGVYDMHGLVWEWVSDFNSALITGESRGDAQGERNLFCGGGAAFASEKQKRDYAAFMRYAYRSSLEGAYTHEQLGFRCAKDSVIGERP